MFIFTEIFLKIMKVGISNISILLVLFCCFVINFNLNLWSKADRVIQHDIKYYYGYLPLKFIYNDLKIEKYSYQSSEEDNLVWSVRTDEGKSILKLSCGLAVLYSPFFFAAHYLAPIFDYPANGFSEPYKFFLVLSTLFYLCLGLVYIRKILLYFKFSEFETAVTILLLGLATNLLAYSTQQAPMSHVYSFALFSMFVYLTINWHCKKNLITFAGIAALFGIITLVRLSNGVIFLFFILYNVHTIKDIFRKISWREILLLISMVVIVWSPQIAYWKYVTGHYFIYSYNDERFFFLDPKIYKGLFNFRKGWLIYTPIMIFSILGFFKLKNELAEVRSAILIYFIVNLYIVFSWWCWWYGGSIGQRALIESYALLSIPLAAFVRYIFTRKWPIKTAFTLLSLFFIWLNIFQIYQNENGSLHHEGMTQKLYFKQFGKLKPIPQFNDLLVWPNAEESKSGKR